MDGPKKKGFRCLEASHDVILHQKKKTKQTSHFFLQTKQGVKGGKDTNSET